MRGEPPGEQAIRVFELLLRGWAARPELVLHPIHHEAGSNDGMPRPRGVLDVTFLEPVGRHECDSVIAVGIGALDGLVVRGQRPGER